MTAFTDIAGLRVGHWTHAEAGTGCTVVLCEEGAIGGVDVRGGAPGTRETDLLHPGNSVERVQAVLLTGGSAYGLAAATGVMRYLEERGKGLRTRGDLVVPIVPSAVLFDLGFGRSDIRPDADSGYAACVAASTTVEEGNVGAGTGATVGKLAGPEQAWKGGVGTCAVRLHNGWIVGALAVVNALGSVFDDLTGARLAGPPPDQDLTLPEPGTNTTLVVVATDADLNKTEANRLATLAHDGLARSIRPAHTAFDGDTAFALVLPRHHAGRRASINHLELAEAVQAAVARSVVRSVHLARSLHGVPGLGDNATAR